MSEPYDVAIIGAGPGGAATAHYLALAGLRVLLLDKFSFPRDKTCGDGLDAARAAHPRRDGAAGPHPDRERAPQSRALHRAERTRGQRRYPRARRALQLCRDHSASRAGPPDPGARHRQRRDLRESRSCDGYCAQPGWCRRYGGAWQAHDHLRRAHGGDRDRREHGAAAQTWVAEETARGRAGVPSVLRGHLRPARRSAVSLRRRAAARLWLGLPCLASAR